MKKRTYIFGIFTGILVMLIVQLTIPGILLSASRSIFSHVPGYDATAYKNYGDKVDAVMSELEENYYEDIDEQDLYEDGLKGLVDGIGDPYTTYYTEDEYASFQESLEGSYEGIGVVVSYDEDNDSIVVVAPFKGSPGEEAGIEAGDIIVGVDGEDVTSLDLESVVEKIKGEQGTDVVITVERDGETLDLTVTRDTVEVPTIESKMLDDGMGYIAISQFDSVTGDQFNEALDELEAQGEKGLIIDLRDNPGGYLQQAYNIADRLLPKGDLIVYTKDKDDNEETWVAEQDTSFDKPIVVLINENSASASEILTGALQDHEKATIVGVTSFGKGIVQNTFLLQDGSALKITIAKYYTPNGNYIHGVGITPDVEVEADSTSDTDNQLEKAMEVIEGMIQ